MILTSDDTGGIVSSEVPATPELNIHMIQPEDNDGSMDQSQGTGML